MKAGDLIRVDFGIPRGSEPGFVRPAVVVTASLVLEERPRTLHVVPVTSNTERNLPTDVPVEAPPLDRSSVAQCHLCSVISTDRIDEALEANVGSLALAQIRTVLGDLLDLPTG